MFLNFLLNFFIDQLLIYFYMALMTPSILSLPLAKNYCGTNSFEAIFFLICIASFVIFPYPESA